MELIDGPTLADRIEQGPLPPDEALDIAMQIAEGLEAAHAGGIVHRDLKPANVKIREDGLVKVLDFGIAKALDTRTNDSGFQQPALTSPTMTRAGIRVGTAAYMSPEQARGKSVDQRTDVWAFGVVLYEMLTGQPAFGSEDETSTIARVLERETDMSTLPPTLEPAVRKALRLCLVKDPRERVADIRDVRLVLKGTFDDEVVATETSPARWVAALVGVAIVASAATWFASPTPPAVEDTGSSSRVVRALVNTAPGTRLTGYALDEELAFASLQRPSRLSMALSPDGRMLAYTAREDEAEDPDLAPRLYLQRLDRDEPTALPGTEGAVMPFFSTDGQSIGFWSPDWELKRLTIDSGDIRTVALEPDDVIGIWSHGGLDRRRYASRCGGGRHLRSAVNRRRDDAAHGMARRRALPCPPADAARPQRYLVHDCDAKLGAERVSDRRSTARWRRAPYADRQGHACHLCADRSHRIRPLRLAAGRPVRRRCARADRGACSRHRRCHARRERHQR